MDNQHETRLSGARVLVVEDEYYLADDLSRSLVSVGAEVVGPVGSLAEAESKLEDGDFDFAVVDMNLRGDFCFSVAERLRSKGVPFVVATGYNQSSLPDSLKDVPRVEKPFTPGQVIELLGQMRQTVG